LIEQETLALSMKFHTSVFMELQKTWTPAFAGVTALMTFYETVKYKVKIRPRASLRSL